jgi:hypothetical protein
MVWSGVGYLVNKVTRTHVSCSLRRSPLIYRIPTQSAATRCVTS